MNKIILILIVTTLIAGGCKTIGESYTSNSSNRSSEFHSVKSIAVVSINGVTGTQNELLANYINTEFIKRGYVVVERKQIKEIKKEIDLQQGNITSTENAVKVGEVVNVDSVVICNIHIDDEKMELGMKLIETETGKIVWIGNGKGTADGNFGTVTGIIIGATVGVLAGEGADFDRGGKALAGVAGGLIGGYTGRSLTPSQTELAKKIIRKTCRKLPYE